MVLYVIGHKKPDTDSIVAAIAYAKFKRILGIEAEPRRAGELNPETKYVMEKFNVKPPELMESAEGKELVLVDHNEPSQMVSGYEKAKIREIIDHHRLGGFVTSEPIFVHIEPVGSTSTIIASWFKERGFEIDKTLASLMLSAILSDTVIFRSPTCTNKDRAIAKELATIAGIKDVEKLGIEMFKAKSRLAEKSARDIILTDFKEYVFKGVRVGIGQVETVDLSELEPRLSEILNEMETVRKERGYNMLIMMLTDILKKGSLLLYSADKEEWFHRALSTISMERRGDRIFYAPGVMSRKKQIVPPLAEYFRG